jgi:predicted ABC-type ATPase
MSLNTDLNSEVDSAAAMEALGGMAENTGALDPAPRPAVDEAAWVWRDFTSAGGGQDDLDGPFQDRRERTRREQRLAEAREATATDADQPPAGRFVVPPMALGAPFSLFGAHRDAMRGMYGDPGAFRRPVFGEFGLGAPPPENGEITTSAQDTGPAARPPYFTDWRIPDAAAREALVNEFRRREEDARRRRRDLPGNVQQGVRVSYDVLRQTFGGAEDAGRNSLLAAAHGLGWLDDWIRRNVTDARLPNIGIDVLDHPLDAISRALERPLIGPAETETGAQVRAISAFLVGFVPWLRVMRAAGVATGTERAVAAGALTASEIGMAPLAAMRFGPAAAGRIAETSAAAALAEFLVRDPAEPNLANLIRDVPIVGELATNPHDPELINRTRNALAAGGANALLEPLVIALQARAAMRRASDEVSRVVSQSADAHLQRPAASFGTQESSQRPQTIPDESSILPGSARRSGPENIVQAGESNAAARARQIPRGELRYTGPDEHALVRFTDGSTEFGRITDDVVAVVRAVRDREFQPGVIRLNRGWDDRARDNGFGELHVEGKHGDSIRAFRIDGQQVYADAAELIADVTANYNRIAMGPMGRLILGIVNGHDRIAVVDLSRVGDGFVVVTAGIRNRGWMENSRWALPWRRTEPSASQAPSAPGSQGSAYNVSSTTETRNTTAAESAIAVSGARPRWRMGDPIPDEFVRLDELGRRIPPTGFADPRTGAFVAAPERLARHGGWVDRASEIGGRVAGTIGQDRVAYFVIGLPGAGKSSMVAEPLSRLRGARIVDADIAKELIPEYQGGLGATAVHPESTAIARQVLARAIVNNENVVLPIVGSDVASVRGTIASLRQHGYRIELYFADVPMEEAANRAMARYYETGRLTEPSYILSRGNMPRETYDILKSEGVDRHVIVSTNFPRGQSARIVQDSADPGSTGQSLWEWGNGRGGGSRVEDIPQHAGRRSGPVEGRARGEQSEIDRHVVFSSDVPRGHGARNFGDSAESTQRGGTFRDGSDSRLERMGSGANEGVDPETRPTAGGASGTRAAGTRTGTEEGVEQATNSEAGRLVVSGVEQSLRDLGPSATLVGVRTEALRTDREREEQRDRNSSAGRSPDLSASPAAETQLRDLSVPRPSHLLNVLPAQAAAAERVGLPRLRGEGNEPSSGEMSAVLYGAVQALQDVVRLAAAGQGGGALRLDGPRAVGVDLERTGTLGAVVDFIEHASTPGGIQSRDGASSLALFNYRANLHAEAYRRATAEGLSGAALARRVGEIVANPPAHIRLRDGDGGDTRALLDAPSDYVRRLVRLRNARGADDAQPFEPLLLTLPLLARPEEMLEYGFRRPPLSLHAARLRDDLAAGGARRDLARAQLGLGGAIMLLAGNAAAVGQITGAMAADGAPAHSMRVGGRWQSYDPRDRLGRVLAFAADLRAGAARGEIEPEDLDQWRGLLASGALAATQLTRQRGAFQATLRTLALLSGQGPAVTPEQLAQAAPFARTIAPAGQDADPLLGPERRLAELAGRLLARRTLWGETEASAQPIDTELAALDHAPQRIRRQTWLAGVTVDLRQYPQVYEEYVRRAGNELPIREFGGLGLRDYLNAVVSGQGGNEATLRAHARYAALRDEGERVQFIEHAITRARAAAGQSIIDDPNFAAFRRYWEAQQARQAPAAQPTREPARRAVGAR